MAKRRCFETDVIESYNFRKLSYPARVLYFSLIAHSDDEGVVANPTIALLISGTDESEIKELIEAEFLIRIDDLLVIKHWHRHNKIQASKVNPSVYSKELQKLTVNSRKEYVFL